MLYGALEVTNHYKKAVTLKALKRFETVWLKRYENASL